MLIYINTIITKIQFANCVQNYFIILNTILAKDKNEESSCKPAKSF